MSDGGRDQVADDLWIEVIDLEVQLREGGFDEGLKVGFADEEVEDVLRAVGVLEDCGRRRWSRIGTPRQG